MEKYLIIDGHNLLFRMFYGIPGSIKTSKGAEIKAVVGFISGVIKYMNKFSPDNVMIVFDSETSILSKTSEYEDYKSNRINYLDVPESENPFVQLPYIFQALNYLEIPYKEVKEFEADDYIASLCEWYKKQYEIIIVSTDQDFFQLINDSIQVFNPNGKEGTVFDSTKVFEKLGVYPSQIIEYKALLGDKSDNITGIRGVGPKTAQRILGMGTISELLNNGLIDEKTNRLLKDNEAVINRNLKLITMKKDIPISVEGCNYKKSAAIQMRALDIIRSSGVY
jgi:DNA polymerase-1